MMQFSKDPEKFRDLLTNDRVSFGSSFQIGGGRLYDGTHCTVK
jgi:hypothetical protein